jgi:hypothetical protein
MSPKPGPSLVIALGIAGFFSAMVVVCVSSVAGTLGYFLPGIMFGAALSLCLWLYGLVGPAWKLLVFTGASLVASALSVLTGVYLEYFSPRPLHTVGTGPDNSSNTALFAAGAVGAFLLLAAVLLVTSSKQSVTKTVFRAMCWSLIGGVLGVAGWNLRPWLGPALWSFQFEHGFTSPNDKLEYAVLQGRTGIDSLMLVWQTGMGLLLGTALLVGNSVKEVRLLGLRQHRRGKGFTRENFVESFRSIGIPEEIPATVFDYYTAAGIWKNFPLSPDDAYSQILSDNPDDIEKDARDLVERLEMHFLPKYVLQKYSDKPLVTLRDMVLWLNWVRQHQPAS